MACDRGAAQFPGRADTRSRAADRTAVRCDPRDAFDPLILVPTLERDAPIRRRCRRALHTIAVFAPTSYPTAAHQFAAQVRPPGPPSRNQADTRGPKLPELMDRQRQE